MEEEIWFSPTISVILVALESVYKPSKASSSSILVRTTREEEGPSSANPKNIKLTGVRSHTNVARPFYTKENEST